MTLPHDITILYRGPLASCDYDCSYCPFAKRRDTPEQLRADRAAVERFVDWVASQATQSPGKRISVLFTPWGKDLSGRGTAPRWCGSATCRMWSGSLSRPI